MDDIFGPMTERYFSIKLSDGMVATSFNAKTKFFGDPCVHYARPVASQRWRQRVDTRAHMTTHAHSRAPRYTRHGHSHTRAHTSARWWLPGLWAAPIPRRLGQVGCSGFALDCSAKSALCGCGKAGCGAPSIPLAAET